ncbi:hypothetical protein MY9_0668 [Bacillus sp. JS]|nr:hypothetical protein MY9_0668 [Bacillus sp. JS]
MIFNRAINADLTEYTFIPKDKKQVRIMKMRKWKISI